MYREATGTLPSRGIVHVGSSGEENTLCFCSQIVVTINLTEYQLLSLMSCGKMSIPDTLCIFYILLKGCLAVMTIPGN